MIEVDEEALAVLVTKMSLVTREYLIDPPYAAEKVFTVLNALASMTAFMICGTGQDQERVLAWFERAVRDELKGLWEAE